MWAGGTSTRQKSVGEKSSEIDAVAKSSDVWERLLVEVKRTGNPEEEIVFFMHSCEKKEPGIMS